MGRAAVIGAGCRAELETTHSGAIIDLDGLREPTSVREDGFTCFDPERGVTFDVAEGQVVAIAYGPAGRVLQTRAPWLQGNGNADVGTGGSFQVPPLVGVGGRAPYCTTAAPRRSAIASTSAVAAISTGRPHT